MDLVLYVRSKCGQGEEGVQKPKNFCGGHISIAPDAVHGVVAQHLEGSGRRLALRGGGGSIGRPVAATGLVAGSALHGLAVDVEFSTVKGVK